MPVLIVGASEGNAQHAGDVSSLLYKTVSVSRNYWRSAQYLVLIAGVALVAALLLQPGVGLLILWNVLIPVAPALIVVAPGLWRNICPMATFSFLPRRFEISRRKIPARRMVALLSASGMIALLLIVPLRHVVFDTDGPMTALMLLLSAGVAISMGSLFEWRSGWCNTLCRYMRSRKLYGFTPAIKVQEHALRYVQEMLDALSRFHSHDEFFRNRHDSCGKVGGPLHDWRFRRIHLGLVSHSGLSRRCRLTEVISAYSGPVRGHWFRLPFMLRYEPGLADPGTDRALLVKVFAATAVSTYYWYRIPALAGFGPNPGTGQLSDLTAVLPISR